MPNLSRKRKRPQIGRALQLLCLTLLPRLLLADGGALIMRVQDHGLTISAFASPVPLRVGLTDISILIQNAADQNPILDGEITLHLVDPRKSEITIRATHAQATNKLLYAANVNLPIGGNWKLRVNYQKGREHATAATAFAVLPAAPALVTYWPYFALVPAGLGLFALNQWLKAQRQKKRAY